MPSVFLDHYVWRQGVLLNPELTDSAGLACGRDPVSASRAALLCPPGFSEVVES